MSFPDSLATRTVKGRFVTYPDGVSAKGTVRIVLSNAMQGPIDHAIVEPFDRTIKLIDGEISIVLPVNDDPQWTSSQYRIVVTVDDKVILRKTFSVLSSYSDPVYLDDIVAIAPTTPGESYVLLASKGVPGGVASLDVNGKLVSSQLPAAAGGEVFWDDVQNKPTTFPADPQIVTWTQVQSKPTAFPPSAHSHLTSDVSGLDVALNTKAPLASPTLTGTPAAPTAAAGTSSTQVATTAFVTAAIAANGPKILVLSAAAAVPGGTPPGTPIIRTIT